ncbi:MAG: glycosyl hydrolase family 28-related protein [Sutterella wadsworthensis]
MIEYVKRLAGPFTSEGQSRLPFGFLIFEKTDVYVATADDPEAQAKMLVYGQDYSVEMNADQTATPGGTVVLTTPIVKGNIFVVGSAVAYTQNMQLTNFSRFPPEIINESLDRIVVQIQQLVELTGRTISLPPTSNLTVSEFLDNLFNAAKSAAKSAEEAKKFAQICEEIKQNIFIYSWDIPHVVDTLDDVEKYPYDGFFAVGGYGDPGHHGQDISNRFVKAKGSTELRTLGERFSDVVNVKDFGAKGDGTTDDTAAIRAAIAATGEPSVNAYGTKTLSVQVLFPKGDYLVSDSALLEFTNSFIGLGANLLYQGRKNPVGASFRNTLFIDSCRSITIDGQVVPYVTRDGLINIGNGQLIIWPDLDGDGDYDADIYAAGNMYLVCESSIHLIHGDQGRLRVAAEAPASWSDGTGVVYLQASGNYLGTKVSNLQISPYNSSFPIAFFDSTTHYVGIGTSTPETNLHVHYAGKKQIIGKFSNAGSSCLISYAASETSGTVCVGASANNYSVRASGGGAFAFGYNESQGNVEANFDIYQYGSRVFRVDSSTSAICPGRDATQQLGSSSFRYSTIFASTGSINTSDVREKKTIVDPDESLMRAWGKVNFRVFKFKDAVEKKGTDARLHVGVIAQQVIEAFASEGLDATRYGLLCYDKWEDEYEDIEVVDTPELVTEDGTVTPAKTHIEHRLVTPAGDRYGIRYEEALALEAAYLRWELQKIKQNQWCA